MTSDTGAVVSRTENGPWGRERGNGEGSKLMARFSGGLEASLLIHAVNNTLLLLPMMLAGQLASLTDRTNGTSGPFILFPIAMERAGA